MTTSTFFQGRRVLVAGGTGMVGRQLTGLLLERGAHVRIASLDDPARALPGTEFRRTDLTHFDACREVCAGMEMVFNLAGIKGSPAMSTQKPASFFVPMMMFNTNLMEAARQAGAGSKAAAAAVVTPPSASRGRHAPYATDLRRAAGLRPAPLAQAMRLPAVQPRETRR